MDGDIATGASSSCSRPSNIGGCTPDKSAAIATRSVEGWAHVPRMCGRGGPRRPAGPPSRAAVVSSQNQRQRRRVDGLRPRPGELRFTGKRFVRHGGERMLIGACVDGLLSHGLLQRHVWRCTEGEARLRHALSTGVLHGVWSAITWSAIAPDGRPIRDLPRLNFVSQSRFAHDASERALNFRVPMVRLPPHAVSCDYFRSGA